MPSAGQMRFRVGFYRRAAAADGYGNSQGDWNAAPDFICWAAIAPRLGGEKVLADRLAGTNYATITVRGSSASLAVTTDWRAKDERSGDLFNIRSIVNPDGRKQFIEMLCEKGAAA